MNQIPKRDRYAEEIARIRDVVGRHPLPNFVTGFDVRLGEFDGDPAMWIAFKLAHDVPGPGPEITELQRLRQAVQADLFDNFDDRYPYFRFEVDRVRAASSS
jgi:hypothetical protein